MIVKSDSAQRSARLVSVHRGSHHLSLVYHVQGLQFCSTIWYHDCDLVELERRYGSTMMQRLYLHIAAFDMNKFASLRIEAIDLGPLSDLVDESLVELWSAVVHGVWAQWRYENDLPRESPPVMRSNAGASSNPAILRDRRPDTYLALSGGGKDSLVSTTLLDRCSASYGTLGYSSSIYGQAALQHRLIDGVVGQSRTLGHHRLTVFDDFLDSPVLELHPEFGVVQLTAAETPASIFQALPVLLQHGYSDLVLGHERSADVGNLTWDVTGEDVNHQWGKSTEAEAMLREYVDRRLLRGVSVFSVLKPIYDVTILGIAAELPFEAIAATHSCNVRKPWCRRCPKCVYVWLSFLAYLDAGRVEGLFGENLFDVEENFDHLYRMVGLSDHTPFECIGQIGEARLALLLCYSKGLRGPLMDRVIDLTWRDEAVESVARFTTVDHGYAGLPLSLRPLLLDTLDTTADATRILLGHRLARMDTA